MNSSSAKLHQSSASNCTDPRLPTVDQLRDTNIAVWGVGHEGSAILRFLRRHLPDQNLVLIDDKPFSSEHQQIIDYLGNIAYLHAQSLTADALSTFDWIIRSPGVCIYRDELAQAKNNGVHITTASNLWYATEPAGTIIAITGSKGKSTTTTLLGHLLKSLGKRVEIGGNIGTPLLDLTNREQPPDYWVIELSSYQISDLGWRPDVALLTCLHPGHLKWHGLVDHYYDDKLKLFDDEEKTTAVINQSDQEVNRRLSERANKRIYNVGIGLIAKADGIYRAGKKLIDAKQISLRGEHNYQNVCGALTTIETLGINIESVIPALKTFEGLPHRLEQIAFIDGVTYINDSIAVIPEATLMAVKSFSDQPVILLIGGQNNHQDWSAFANQLSKRPPKTVITMHESGSAIASALKDRGNFNVIETKDLREATQRAKEIATSESVILMSPAAPSFDAYDNFEHRAAEFRRHISATKI
ncbi:MAG: UDP-N-acetylmuramoyl-L-alanine--D-glutamate ligase [Gammaproteobacteria bacterium]|nr:UDP-N-acetylmuramoyl-L-alanine--D-glutamate ligase [Gammaproteobacteria bacterium]